METSELQDLLKKLNDEFGAGKHWDIVKAEQYNEGDWILRVRDRSKKENEGDKKNESF